MKARDSLLVALPALALGVALGYPLGAVLSAPTALEAATLEAGDAADGSPRETASAGAALVPLAAPPNRAAAEPEAAPTRVAPARLDRAIDGIAAPAVAPRTGTGTISGQVRDETGAPLGGVTVRAVLRSFASGANDPSKVGAGPPVDDGLDAYLRAQAGVWAESRAGLRLAQTGPDGAYLLDGLGDDGSYHVEAYREGYVFEAERTAFDVVPGQTVSFRAERVHEIPIELVFASGDAPAEGQISVARGERKEPYTWSSAQPALRLAPGRVGLRAYAGVSNTSSYRGEVDSTHASEEMSLDVVAHGDAPLRLVLVPRTGVRGRVADDWAGGTSWSQQVQAVALPASGAVDEKALTESSLRTQARGGRYSMLDLPPGRYAVGLTTYSESVLVHEVVEVTDAVVQLDLVVPEPDSAEHLVVNVLGPDGRPLGDVTFSMTAQRKGGSSSGGIQARRSPDGSYWIRPGGRYDGLLDEWPAGSSYTLTAQHSELGRREVALQSGQRSVEILFAEPGSLVVTVAGYAGSGYEGKLSVDVQRVVEGENETSRRPPRSMYYGGRGRNDGGLAADGKARFDGLAPGTYDVGLAIGERFREQIVETRRVQIAAGEQTVTLALPTLHELRVHAPGLTPGTNLYLRAKDGADGFIGGRDVEIDNEHRARFEGIVAGDYVLTGNGLNKEVDVTVPGGEVYLDAREPDCFRVAIGDIEGALYKAGLRAGDLVVGVNGVDFTGTNRLWSTLRDTESETWTWSVLRGRERLTFSMPAIPVRGNWYEKLGGMLSPANRD